MNKIQWEKDVCFGQTPCKIRYSNLCITFGTFIIVRHLSTRIRFHLNTQHFLYGYGFRPHVSDEHDQWKRNFSKTLSTVELFKNTVFACTCGKRKTELFENAEDTLSVQIRADKSWAVKRARPSKKVWLELGLFSTSVRACDVVCPLTTGDESGLFIRHYRCHWIIAAWFVFLHFLLVSLCWYAVSERQMLLFFAGGLIGVDKHLFQRVSLITSMTLPLNYIFVLLLANVDVIPKQKQLSTV